MPRIDTVGMFWDDTPPPKPPKKEKIKRIPPDPVWLLPTYLPGLAQARAMQPNIFTDAQLLQAALDKEQLAWDIECYPNYFLVAFKSIQSGKVIYFEQDDRTELDRAKLNWVLNTFCVVDFNGDNYDVPIASIAIQYGANCYELFNATTEIIVEKLRPQDVLKRHKCKRLRLNHIDLIELVAGDGSLKLLAGRLHTKRMQDLPFKPGTYLSPDQICILRWYCINDLDNTIALRHKLLPDIELREKMSMRYGIDLRSHSDAQIAEAVIASELKKMTGLKYVPRAKVNPQASFKYQAPYFIKFQTPRMNQVLDIVKAAWFSLDGGGRVTMPEEFETLDIQIGNSFYNLQIGGLHSKEKKTGHFADKDTILADFDVASFYPRIILNCGLFPSHLGKNFLIVFGKLVEERLLAKSIKDTVAADGLKIVVNGTYGKLGSIWSVFYAPDLMLQVTLTGQLSLLMLIETLELRGIPVVSGNTDGIVIKCPKSREAEMYEIVNKWQKDTNFELEETRYHCLLSRDVNDYFAVKQKFDKDTKTWTNGVDGCKVKGVYSEKGSNKNTTLSKNPTHLICSDAVMAFLTTGVPLTETIRKCRDIRRFLCVRAVKGKDNGGVKDGVFLGKAIRWYYAVGQEGEIVYAVTGNKVPRSEGAKPLMELPDEFPDDIDYQWYEAEARKMLVETGYIKEEVESKQVEPEVA